MKISLILFFVFASSCTFRKAVETVRLTLAFGYKDTRPTRFVGDRYEKTFLIEKLLEACDGPKNGACGFRRHADDASLFFKNVDNKNGKPVLIQLNIFGSAISPDDDLNRKSEYQKFISEYAEHRFLESLHLSKVIIYVGHSRDGGGPDFAPPKLTKTNNVDYKWYRKNRPGLEKIKKEIARVSSKDETKSLTILSCNSETYFNAKLLIANEKLNVHTVNGLIYFKDAIDAAIEEISKSVIAVSDRDR